MGNQTMYCSDCHGSNTSTNTVVPDGGENGKAWGPHGSNNDFILKGGWSFFTGSDNPNDLCFNCHEYDVYAEAFPAVRKYSGFSSGANGGPLGARHNNLHNLHAEFMSGKMRCNWCHVAVPHGFKNKALLVNLNDIGPEAGYPPGTAIRVGDTPFTAPPYYNNAAVWIYRFANSGEWRAEDCMGGGPGGSMADACERTP